MILGITHNKTPKNLTNLGKSLIRNEKPDEIQRTGYQDFYGISYTFYHSINVVVLPYPVDFIRAIIS